MTPTQWLEIHAHGFAALAPEERQAILDFALLWSFFEARALATSGSAKRICALCRSWEEGRQLSQERFAGPLQYFRQRYFANGEPTNLFHGLHLRARDCPALVRQVLQGESSSVGEVAAALLIVVFRLRNNLFHGTKWDYGIQGQLPNFGHANVVLMEALSVVGKL